jgi:hypothetical protein
MKFVQPSRQATHELMVYQGTDYTSPMKGDFSSRSIQALNCRWRKNEGSLNYLPFTSNWIIDPSWHTANYQYFNLSFKHHARLPIYPLADMVQHLCSTILIESLCISIIWAIKRYNRTCRQLATKPWIPWFQSTPICFQMSILRSSYPVFHWWFIYFKSSLNIIVQVMLPLPLIYHRLIFNMGYKI